jgi:23S rRNA pseudouridine1911/1915/1917 synthase
MAYINHPLLGDVVYSSGKNKYGFTSQALHAKILGFIHPSTGKYMEFDSELPTEFQEMLKTLRK